MLSWVLTILAALSAFLLLCAAMAWVDDRLPKLPPPPPPVMPPWLLAVLEHHCLSARPAEFWKHPPECPYCSTRTTDVKEIR